MKPNKIGNPRLPASVSRTARLPSAPAAYRPQPVPLVLQRKRSAQLQPPVISGRKDAAVQTPHSHSRPQRGGLHPPHLKHDLNTIRPGVRVGPVQMRAKTPAASVPRRASFNSRTIQRNCGTPGCNNPSCLDPANHGFESVRTLRGRTVYSGSISSSDIGTGSGTSTGTRSYVNSPTTTYPSQVAIEYSTGSTGNRSEFINQPLALGQRADAGHIFGRQYGGVGNQDASVFPQHPQTNRGNSYLGQPTRDFWRGPEDEIRSLAQSGQTTDVSVTLRDVPRVTYERACSRCALIYPLMAVVCAGCGHVLP
jgi:hypothetical protein